MMIMIIIYYLLINRFIIENWYDFDTMWTLLDNIQTNLISIAILESKTIDELTKIEYMRLQVILCVLDVTQ